MDFPFSVILRVGSINVEPNRFNLSNPAIFRFCRNRTQPSLNFSILVFRPGYLNIPFPGPGSYDSFFFYITFAKG